MSRLQEQFDQKHEKLIFFQKQIDVLRHKIHVYHIKGKCHMVWRLDVSLEYWINRKKNLKLRT